jgi:hypothetical protein
MKMKTTKQIGIWMDHSNAFFIELSGDSVKNSSITSEFTHEDMEQSLRKNENLMHNKEQQKQSAYFNRIADVIKTYNEVLLFGPTDAKSELLNLLKADHLFEKIKMEVKQTDKMTGFQMHTFVKNHFK